MSLPKNFTQNDDCSGIGCQKKWQINLLIIDRLMPVNYISLSIYKKELRKKNKYKL